MQGLVYGVKATSAVGCSGFFVDVYTSLSFSDGRMMTILSPWWRYWLISVEQYIIVHWTAALKLLGTWNILEFRFCLGPFWVTFALTSMINAINAIAHWTAAVEKRCRTPVFFDHLRPPCAVSSLCICCWPLQMLQMLRRRRFHFVLIQIFAQNNTHSLSTGILSRRGSFGTVQRPWGLAKKHAKTIGQMQEAKKIIF